MYMKLIRMKFAVDRLVRCDWCDATSLWKVCFFGFFFFFLKLGQILYHQKIKAKVSPHEQCLRAEAMLSYLFSLDVQKPEAAEVGPQTEEIIGLWWEPRL